MVLFFLSKVFIELQCAMDHLIRGSCEHVNKSNLIEMCTKFNAAKKK